MLATETEWNAPATTLAWIELHQTLPQSGKLMRLKRELRIRTPQAVGHLCLLWLWALDNAPDGAWTKTCACTTGTSMRGG